MDIVFLLVYMLKFADVMENLGVGEFLHENCSCPKS